MIFRRRAVLAGAALLACGAVALSCLTAHAARSPIDGVIEPEAIPIFSPMGGKIVQVFAHRGDRVAAGQLLLRFEAGELDARLARVHSTLRAVPTHLLDAAAALFERIPPSTIARLVRTDPEILAAEREYIDALAESEHNPSAASEERLKRAEGQRKRAYQLAGELRPERLSAFRNLHDEGLKTLRWLEAQRARFEVRAPSDGVIELLDLEAGDVVPPLSPVALLDIGEHPFLRQGASVLLSAK